VKRIASDGRGHGVRDSLLGWLREAHLPRQLTLPEPSLRAAVRLEPYVRAVGIVLALALVVAFIVATNFLPNQVTVKVGGVAPRDILAPRATHYESTVKTEEARAAAAARVPDQFDAGILDTQRGTLGRFQTGVKELRNQAGGSQRLVQLQVLTEVPLSDQEKTFLLTADAATVEGVLTQADKVLSDVMSQGVRPGPGLTLAQSDISRRVGQLRLDPLQAQLVTDLSRGYLKPNFDAAGTQVRQQRARSDVPPVVLAVERGEVIIRSGDVVTPLQLEKAQAVGLLHPQYEWARIIGTFVLVLALFAIALTYLVHFRPAVLHAPRQLVLLGVLFVGILLLSKLLVPIEGVGPYLVPVAAVPLLVATLIDPGLAIITALGAGMLVGIVGENVLTLSLVGFVGGSLGAITVRRVERLSHWVQAAVIISAANFSTTFGIGLLERRILVEELLKVSLLSALAGVVSVVIALGLFSFLAEAFGILTPMRLLDLMNPNNPLLKRLMVTAPGTYHHSVVAANLAEAGAEAIGANSLLARLGCYFHDIGKIKRPHFFIENQAEMGNIHENLSPAASAQILDAHVTDGVELLTEYKFPEIIKDLVGQHQGTTVKRYFYQQAQEQGGQGVQEADFRYPGPKPQSREAALVMMADTVEASARALRDKTPEGIRNHVHRMIQAFKDDGQLDDSGLSFGDVLRIEEAFVGMVLSVYHVRVEYPGQPVSNPTGLSTALGAGTGGDTSL
jgi:putative nucleotidyltransferase with HDIG domain